MHWKFEKQRTRWWGRRRWMIWDPKDQKWIDGDFRWKIDARDHAAFLLRVDRMIEQIERNE